MRSLVCAALVAVLLVGSWAPEVQSLQQFETAKCPASVIPFLYPDGKKFFTGRSDWHLTYTSSGKCANCDFTTIRPIPGSPPGFNATGNFGSYRKDVLIRNGTNPGRSYGPSLVVKGAYDYGNTLLGDYNTFLLDVVCFPHIAHGYVLLLFTDTGVVTDAIKAQIRNGTATWAQEYPMMKRLVNKLSACKPLQ